MLHFGAVTHTPITTIDVDDRQFRVTVHTAHDGVEFVGRLWFADVEWVNSGIPDRGVLPGRTEAEVLVLARRLRPDELLQRYRRANAEKRPTRTSLDHPPVQSGLPSPITTPLG